MYFERIQKVLANLGVASQGQIERWIVVEGRVVVNGLSSAPTSPAVAQRHIVYYKPATGRPST